jgi:hypothetical protein
MPDINITTDPVIATGSVYPANVTLPDRTITPAPVQAVGSLTVGTFPDISYTPAPVIATGTVVTGTVRLVAAFPTVLVMTRSAKICDIGDAVRITATFTINGALVDPTTVMFKHKAPLLSLVTRTYSAGQAGIIRSATGTYYADIEPTVSGVHYVRFEGSGGTPKAAGELSVQVRVARAYE